MIPALDRFRLVVPAPDGPPVIDTEGTWDRIGSAIDDAATRTDWFLVVRPGAMTHHDLAEEITAAITDPGLRDIRWLALASDGFDLDARQWDCGNYLEDPADPAPRPLRIAASGDPAVLLVHSGTYRTAGIESAGSSRDEWVEQLLTAEQPVYLSHRIRFSAREPMSHEDPRPGRRAATWLSRVRPDPTVSIVIRTTGDRPVMLGRALAAAHDSGASAVIVASPLADADLASRLSDLAPPGSDVRGVAVPDTSVPGRTAALLAGLDAADTDYVWFVDDDDWAAPGSVAAIVRSIHARDRPVVVGTVTAHEEHWSGDELTSRRPIRTYVAAEWHRAFTGWNHLPNCALVYPTTLLRERLATTTVRHDLGEDYALQLLAVTSPGAAVLPIEDVLANVSVRQHGTTVSMADRTPWLRDLGSHISSLVDDPHASAAALWRLGRSVREIPYPAPTDLRASAAEDPAEGPPTPPKRPWLRRARR